MPADPELPPILVDQRSPDDTRATSADPVMDGHMAKLIGKLVHERTQLGTYELVRKLGAGGMGEVFAARHLESGEEVALKTLSSTTATRLYRFKREFRALADVRHHNLIRLHELVVPEAGTAFFTMELLDGRPFVAWVRGSTPVGSLPELDRLDHVLRQLVDGVHHLHSHGCVHRDLKPSNVLVTGEGRVVVLDFGLVSEMSEPERGITHDRQILGTPSYMAPEQARAEPVGPAADWYAVGVMLFECLTGRLPHEGPALKQMISKQEETPDPGNDVAGAPEHLRMLCVRLLTRNPDARPRGRELLERLHSQSSSVTRPAQVFVGRREELATLHAALHDVFERQEPVVAHLRGRSGDGKSALVRRFRSELGKTETLVLYGRCREHESVPYKGVDAIVDALSAHLRRMPEPRRGDLRPPDLDALVRVFPVLDEIWPAAAAQELSPAEVRKLGGVTLRKLLWRVSEAQPLLVHIDDFQWADLDSVSLLQELIRPPDAPAMLLLLSYRSEAEESVALRELLASEMLSGSRVCTIELGPLSAADARELASSLLWLGGEAEPLQRGRAEAIALRSRGSPFFISQLALGDGSDTTDSDLDHIVVRRLSGLDANARRLLEVVAVFGGPLPVSLALELSAPTSEADVVTLSEQGLLVREETRTGEHDERIETAHDRVREVVLGELAADVRARLHWRIGEQLLTRHEQDPTPEKVFASIDHLDAGMEAAGTLTSERRLALAELGREGGQRALESTGWITARGCFEFAYGLVHPWLVEARQGRGHHELCVAVAFGRAQAAITLHDASGDAMIEDLLGWSLSMTSYGLIAKWYSWSLLQKADFQRGSQHGIEALRHLGFRVPRRGSWYGAALSYVRGWWSILKLDLAAPSELPTITDERIGAGMDILAVTIGTALATDPMLSIILIRIYDQMLTRHGFHDGAGIGLVGLAFPAATIGRIREAKALCELAQRVADHHGMSALARYSMQGILLQIMPIYCPAPTVVTTGDRFQRRAREAAPRTTTEIIEYAHAINSHHCASVPLPSLVDSLDIIEAEHDGFDLKWIAAILALIRHRALTLMTGESSPLTSSETDLNEHPALIALAVTTNLQAVVLMGDHDGAWDLTCQWSHDYERRIGATWTGAMHSMLNVVTMSERWPNSNGRERRRMRKMLRVRRRVAHRWAQYCSENYQPMLDVIDGELARIGERDDDAITLYEHARSAAEERQLHWVAGLASERLAKLGLHRGHALLAEAAFEAARRAYETWGATAVVRRLERERVVTSR